jgi:glycerol-3-phosphate cytidylyltransferase
MRTIESKVVGAKEIEKICSDLKGKGKILVSTNGCFDILHWGHINYLEKARALGDVLICAVNSDASVRELKGPSRPIHDEKTRARQVAGLESVDWVVVFDHDTPNEILKLIKPSLHVKGGDYDPNQLPEKEVVEQYGGKVRCLPLVEGFSTTGILERSKN